MEKKKFPPTAVPIVDRVNLFFYFDYEVVTRIIF